MSPNATMVVERDVPARMRDGTILHAHVYRPGEGGPWPVLLQRTPYDKSQPIEVGVQPDPLRATAAGYALVVQDTRGRYSSDGAFTPFVHEVEDGYDTVEWAAAQPWCDGNVGMFGASYVGYTQWMAASLAPPHLRAISPIVATSDLHDFWVYEGGALAQWFDTSWLLASLGADVLARHAPGDADRGGRLLTALDRLREHLPALPGAVDPALDDACVGDIYRSWLAHPERDDFWRALSPREAHARITVPAFNIAGWYDCFIGGSLDNYTGMRAHGATEEARTGTRLVVGPWRHALPLLADPAGEVVFGLGSQGTTLDLAQMQLDWFDRWLRPAGHAASAATADPDEPPIRLYVMGADVWRDEAEWPLRRAAITEYHLRSGGSAQSLRGDGRLTVEPPPSDEPPDTFVADPADPVPTRGGNLCCWQLVEPPGAFDQCEIEARDDVLVYSTEPLTGDVEVTGPVRLFVHVASTAPDFDVTAKLVDVAPDGFARNVCEGIRRARYRHGTDREVPLPAGEVAEIEVDLIATANLFRAGHRIRLEIAASNWPRFDRNPQTGGPIAAATELRPARQTVFHDASRPSRLLLPVVPRT